ncbi:DUF1810 domain-containing protein [Sphingorhabdus sp.]|uniref:DUF1810 domain-containing protein n=1 Tax=Sphingorhabdus sp. TaxID=1902408 RepID=UPI00391B482B
MPKFDLARFEHAQREIYDVALKEIQSGKKRTHWIWFIFPQVVGLGLSQTSVHFAITSLEEAQAYLAHPLLGARLREMTGAMNASPQSNAEPILGATDAAKFRSSMTLFHEIAPYQHCFRFALDKFFGGSVDQQTVQRVAAWRRLPRVRDN